MKTKINLIVLLLLALLGCKKEKVEVEGVGKGDLFVIVNDHSGGAEGAIVYTVPQTIQGVTDETGTVLLRGLKPGSYEVYSYLVGVGAGKFAVNIMPDDLAEVVVGLWNDINIGPAPVIDILLPVESTDYVVGETVVFSASVQDDVTAPEEISIKWESNLDGELSTSHPDENGLVTFVTKTLSKGQHKITLTAEDTDGFYSSNSILVNTESTYSLQLQEPVKEGGEVTLSWEQYSGSDFLRFEVYRFEENCTNSRTKIGTIEDVNNHSFVDCFAPFVERVCYQITLVTTEDAMFNSNAVSVDFPSGDIFTGYISCIVKHPNQSFAYLIQSYDSKLLKYDYTTMKVVKEVGLPRNFEMCSIGDNGLGLEIYVPSYNGRFYIYDAEDLTEKAVIHTEEKPRYVVSTDFGVLITSEEYNLRSYRRSTGELIDEIAFTGGYLDIKKISGKNEIIGKSGASIWYFSFDEEGNFLSSEHKYAHSSTSSDFSISSSGEYFITANGYVYRADSTLAELGDLQGSFSKAIFDFNEDGTIIYFANKNYQTIDLFQYSSLQFVGEQQTKGYPNRMVRDENQLIVVSYSTNGNSIWGIEKVRL